MMIMKKTFFAFATVVLLASCLSLGHAQSVMVDDLGRLQVAYKTTVPEQQMAGAFGTYTLLAMPDFSTGGEIGSPALPVRNDIIEVPFCDDITVTVTDAVYDTLQLSPYTVFYPLQPSRSKSDTAEPRWHIDQVRYATDAFYGLPLADVKVMGIARDRRLATLSFAPVQVNPVTAQVVVCRSAKVTVTYVNADAAATLDHFRRYYTPAFAAPNTLNKLFAKTVGETLPTVPLRMVIAVPNVLRCHAIQRFADWKRRQGLMVDLLYYQDQNIGTNTALADYLTSLYTGATAESPAPTFLLLVGDHNQLPAFDSRLPYAGYWSAEPDNDHVTDLYFVTWTANDVLPDCYQGRFSATDTATLASIVDKTLLYEQYAFDDDAYLSRAVLIAGEDNAAHTESGWSADYAWQYADPTMDYIAYNYVNEANGYTDVTYYKNDVNYAPTGVTVSGYCSDNSAPATLRNLYNTGIGWINYSAHGDWNKWHKPAFTVNDASSMSNNGKPSFMIGNCCLTAKFDESVCLGESLLRRGGNAGAVAYIGGTNSTLWEQDFDWSVGVRSNIRHNLSPNYNASNLGTYDRLFHTHGESFIAQAVTAGSMVYFGNLAVNASSSTTSYKKYYWEIYELFGDPSLLPWLGTAQTLEPTVYLSEGGISVEVRTLPNAYVALVGNDGTLRGATFTANGNVSFPVSSADEARASTVAITLQGYRPCFVNCATVGIDRPGTLHASIHPNPATDFIAIDGLPADATIDLFDMQGRHVSSFSTPRFSIASLPAGVYLLRLQTPTASSIQKIVKK